MLRYFRRLARRFAFLCAAGFFFFDINDLGQEYVQVIKRERVLPLGKLLWRSSKG
jgi:hypothetical protein